MNFYRNAYVYFYNDKIVKIIDGKIFAEIAPRQIRKLHKTVSYALPIHYGLDSVGGKSGINLSSRYHGGDVCSTARSDIYFYNFSDDLRSAFAADHFSFWQGH